VKATTARQTESRHGATGAADAARPTPTFGQGTRAHHRVGEDQNTLPDGILSPESMAQSKQDGLTLQRIDVLGVPPGTALHASPFVREKLIAHLRPTLPGNIRGGQPTGFTRLLLQ
jgi:hypothetical protein